MQNIKTEFSSNYQNYSLRLIKPGDASGFFQLVNNNYDRLKDFFAGTVAQNQSENDSVLFIQEALVKYSSGNYYPFIISEIDNRIIGFIDIKNIDIKIPKAEIGSFIDTNYASKGIITFFLSEILGHFFIDLEFEKMYLRTHQANTSAQIVAKKLGFKEEGILRKDYRTTDGKLIDLIYYGILKDEYQNNRNSRPGLVDQT
jgi:RimJ/RimL family protein N-acetyltransferase